MTTAQLVPEDSNLPSAGTYTEPRGLVKRVIGRAPQYVQAAELLTRNVFEVMSCHIAPPVVHSWGKLRGIPARKQGLRNVFLAALLLCPVFVPETSFGYLMASGSYTGNATDNRTIDISDTTTPSVTDFQPELVIVKCNTTEQAVWSTATMGADASLVLNTNAGPVTNRIQAFSANGFQIGSDNQVNASGVTCFYLALAKDGVNDDFAVGTYAGDGLDARDIDISDTSDANDFQPDFVAVQTETSSDVFVFKFAALTGDQTCSQASGASCATSNRIQALNSNGFEVGTSGFVNGATDTVHYWAMKNAGGSSIDGTYAGDASDDRQITTLGFQPEFLLMKANSATANNVMTFRFKDNSGDESCVATTATCGTDQIQDFLVNGFEVGTNLRVNESGVDYYWYAIRAIPAAAGSSRRRIAPIFFQ
jgi:hypothetical protein